MLKCAFSLQSVNLCSEISSQVVDQHGESGLCMLPTKFRKLVWVRKGEYVLVTKSDGDISTAAGTKGGVTYMIKRPILREHVKDLVRAGKWPEAFETDHRGPDELPSAVAAGGEGGQQASSGAGTGDDDDRPTDGAAPSAGKHLGLVDLGDLAMGMGEELGLVEGGGSVGASGQGDRGPHVGESTSSNRSSVGAAADADSESEDDLDF